MQLHALCGPDLIQNGAERCVFSFLASIPLRFKASLVTSYASNAIQSLRQHRSSSEDGVGPRLRPFSKGEQMYGGLNIANLNRRDARNIAPIAVKSHLRRVVHHILTFDDGG
jgi:hypothetical protein